MSLPRYKMTMLALTLGIATAMVGCSSSPKKPVVDQGPQSSEQVYIEKAQKALERGQHLEAIKQLEGLNTYYPTSHYAPQAQLELMYVKFQQKDYDGSIALADAFIRLNPQHAQADYAYYVRGVSNMEQNYSGLIRYTSLKQAHRDVSYLKLAYQNFVDLIRRYPSSQYAVDAAQRMVFINQELAEHEMNTARFNFKRKAWVAALERAQWIVEHYPNTPQTPEALAMIAQSYQKLGDQDAANRYIDILRLNYPHLVRANGSIHLSAVRSDSSWINRATLGVFGRNAENIAKNEQAPVQTTAPTEIATPVIIENESNNIEKSILINRLSSDLID